MSEGSGDDVDPAEAVAFVEETIVSLGTWGFSQDQIEMTMMRGVARRYETPTEPPKNADEAMARGFRTLKGRSRRF